MNSIRYTMVLLLPLVMLVFIGEETAYGYGWGYKKSTDQQVPEVGKYKDILAKYDGIYHDDSGDKVIYLTFDNGYEQGYTKQILNILKKEHVPATFFVTGHYVTSEPQLIQQMVDEGHIIGNHSYHHPDFTQLDKVEVKEELKSLEKAVATVSDQKEMTYLRPPKGTFNATTLKWAREFGYTHVFWSLAFKDWETNKQKGSTYAYDQIMDQLHAGAVILLHTVSEDNAKALEKVIHDAKKQGYTFKSLEQ